MHRILTEICRASLFASIVCSVTAHAGGHEVPGTGAAKTAEITNQDSALAPLCTLSASPSSIAAGASSILTASCSPSAESYAWTGGTCAGKTTASCTVAPSMTSSYTVAGSNAGGAGKIASTTVMVASAPPGWDTAGSLSTTRINHTATLLPNGKVLVVGGRSSGFDYLNSAELYDPATKLWSAASPLATKRSSHTATLLRSGKVLVTGGIDNNLAFLASAELYDPATNLWTDAGTFAPGRTAHTATLLSDGKVLIVGGFNTSVRLETAHLYDPASNAWTAAGSLARGRSGHMAAMRTNGSVLVAGGLANGFVYLDSVEMYDPETNSWTAAPALATARTQATATPLPNGKVLVAGGNGRILGAIPAEMYDPASNKWIAAGTLVKERWSHSATLLPDGRVLLAGGSDGYADLASSEVYDPATNGWATVGSLATSRSGHTSTLLQNGRVLAAGGMTNNGFTYLASAELFDAPVVTEFYNIDLDNYFITSNTAEARAIDGGGAGPGWIRTGNSFKAGGSAWACRFYGSQSPGPNSHFYTLNSDECNSLKAEQFITPATKKRWNFESLDFMSVPTIGSCPDGAVPVYRAYNNGFSRSVDSNHRITSSLAAIQEVVARGWINEGAVMCAPL